jgi:hypothetical protein
MLDDGEATAADRRERRMERAGQGLTAAVTHRELYPGRPQGPGHPQSGSGQRPGVQDGVAEQLAHHEGRVPDGARKDAAGTEFPAESPTGRADAGRHAREQHDARLTHLQRVPPRGRDQVNPGTSQNAPPSGIGNRQPHEHLQPIKKHTVTGQVASRPGETPAIARFTVTHLATSANIG